MDGEQLCEEVWSRFESSIHDPVVGINDGFSAALSPPQEGSPGCLMVSRVPQHHALVVVRDDAVTRDTEVLQVSGVAGMFVSSLSGAASHPCKGGDVEVHLPTGFKGDPRDSISNKAFGRKVSVHSFPLQLFLPLVDSGGGLLNIMVGVDRNRRG